MPLTLLKKVVRCWRCGGTVVGNYDEEFCINCNAPYDGHGHPVFTRPPDPFDDDPRRDGRNQIRPVEEIP